MSDIRDFIDNYQASIYDSISLHKRQLGKYLQYRRIDDIDKERTYHWHD